MFRRTKGEAERHLGPESVAQRRATSSRSRAPGPGCHSFGSAQGGTQGDLLNLIQGSDRYPPLTPHFMDKAWSFPSRLGTRRTGHIRHVPSTLHRTSTQGNKAREKYRKHPGWERKRKLSQCTEPIILLMKAPKKFTHTHTHEFSRL